MKILNPQKNCLIVGFDSAWTDNPKSPGAISALGFNALGEVNFFEPGLKSFDGAFEWIERQRKDYKLCLIAIDQPTIVPNLTGSRMADRVAGSVVSFIGGGVQPANRSKVGMFDDDAPIWKFLDRLDGHSTSIYQSRIAESGIYVIEVFPALSLPALNPNFNKRSGAPKYNPANRKKFKPEHWKEVLNTVRQVSDTFSLSQLVAWVDNFEKVQEPKKHHQDMLDSIICVLIGLLWRAGQENDSIVIGDEREGYIIAASSNETRERLTIAGQKLGVTVR